MKKRSFSYNPKKFVIAVIGSHRNNDKVDDIAIKLGKLLAKVGVIVVCGGIGGVMMAVAKGVESEGGLSVGILPGDDRAEANPYITIPIATGLGYTRNTIVSGCADAVIALPGEYGTLSEISFALNMKKPVIGIGSWKIKGMIQVKNAREAVREVKKIMDASGSRSRVIGKGKT